MKRVLSIILVIVMLCSCFAGFQVTSNAAGYPLVIGRNVGASIGEDCSIVYAYYPEYTNEELIFRLYDPNGKLVDEKSGSYYNSSIGMRNILYTIQTDNFVFSIGALLLRSPPIIYGSIMIKMLVQLIETHIEELLIYF